MAVAVVGTPVAVATAGSYTAEVGSDRLVVLIAFYFGGTQTDGDSSITMGAQSGNKEVENLYSAGPDDTGSAIFTIKEADIPSGAQTISLSNTNTPDTTQIYCYTLSGVDQTTPVKDTGGESKQAHTATTGYLGVTTDASGMLIGGAGHTGFIFDSWTPPTGWTEDFDADIGGDVPTGGRYATDGTTETDNFTNSSSRNAEWTCSVISVSPVAVGGGTILPFRAHY